MEFVYIDHRSELLKQVIALGDKNKATLGMLPEGAFFVHAKKKTILVASENGQVAGYLLYRISQRKRFVSITHLCVHKDFQGRGISITLLQNLKMKYANIFSGIMLTCRADYTYASALWEKFGFKARDKKKSRAKTGDYYLIRWLYDFGNPNLFSGITDEEGKIKAILDSNIIIPLSENNITKISGIEGLTADWLTEEVEFVCTQEMYNEVNRDEDIQRAEKTRSFLKKLEVVSFKPDKRDLLVEELRKYLPGTTPNDSSDRRQLAECIASGINYFITLDTEMLNQSDHLYERYGVEVLRPIEFLLLIDENSNSMDYRALRLAGAAYDSSKLNSEDIEIVVASFCGLVVNEGKQDLRNVIVHCLKDLKHGHVQIIKNRTGEAIGMYGITFDDVQLVIEVIRIKKGVIAQVLFQQVIRDIIIYSLSLNLNLVVNNELTLSGEEQAILANSGFVENEGRWTKLSLIGIQPFATIMSHSQVKYIINTADADRDKENAEKDLIRVNIERKLWPVKISDLNIPSYIIPIRPFWASQLFDFYLANVSLFGAAETLTWSRENIYYRNVQPVSEKVPGRILWYASSEEKAIGRSKGIVATSYLDEVYIDRAKDIFKRYKRFGVYAWDDIYKLAKKDAENEIKALKFSDTEVFKNIVPLDKVNEIMLKNNRPKNSFPSPVEISSAIFNEIYREGING
jgi:predicted nucleic acid-binding protein